MAENYPSQNAPNSRPARYSPSSKQAKLVTALWDRMTQLFGHRWTSKEGDKTTEAGHLTGNFLLWCRKLEGLTDEQWRRGFEKLEYDVRMAARAGDESWPPSYAEFLGFCDRDHGMVAHKPFARSLPLPEQMRQERRDKARQRLASIARMLDE